NQSMPLTLFKYRNCTENHFDALYNDQIWTAAGELMNDGYDARIYFDKMEVEAQLADVFSDDSIKAMIKNIQDKVELPPQIKSIPGMQQRYTSISQKSEDELMIIFNNFKDFLKSNYYDFRNEISSLAQKAIKFSSLCEDISSPSMWGLYSNNETGFAIEYYFESFSYETHLANKSSAICTIFPMIYNNRKYKVPTEYIIYLLQNKLLRSMNIPNCFLPISLPCQDVTVPTKIALHKSMDWSSEKEWRIFCTSNDVEFQSKPISSFFKEPKAIYLGRRISTINEKILKNIASEKKIPIYKMELNDNSPTYELINKPI
ncbi:MAG: DUF2971 domain-containing protein, partial [Oscillospiraceae bacterium]|nr:DUF2971 domain-containing protein [Oscillospiraceae bacterium]